MSFPFRRILAPVDFSACSEVSVALAITMAERFDATVTLLHAWEVPVVAVVPLGPTHGRNPPVPPETLTSAATARSALSDLADRLRATTAVTIELEVEEGSPHEVIEEASRDFDLVVMGTHGRGVLAHAILGSVAERVVRASKCPVLTVRAEAMQEQSRER